MGTFGGGHTVAILNQENLTNTFKYRSEDEGVSSTNEARAAQVEEIASAKALRQEGGCLQRLRNSNGAGVAAVE